MKKTISLLFLSVLFCMSLGIAAKCAWVSYQECIAAGGGMKGVSTAYRNITKNELSFFVLGRNEIWVNLYGAAQRAAGVDVIPDEDRTVYRLSNDALTFHGREEPAFSAKETEGISTIKSTSDAAGAQSWFIYIPHKFCEQEVKFAARGVQDESAERQRAEIAAYRQEGYSILDLHSAMHAQKMPHVDQYYRTDHHWKTRTALWAAREIAGALGLDTSALREDGFTVETYPNCFLGSEGKHCGRFYSRPDDFELLLPKAETSFTRTFLKSEETKTGSFDEALLFRRHLERTIGAENAYAVFLNGDDAVTIQNNLNPNGVHITFIKDSYTISVAPYLALLCGRLDLLDPRYDKEIILPFIRENRPDYVCVSVSNSMGSHTLEF